MIYTIDVRIYKIEEENLCWNIAIHTELIEGMVCKEMVNYILVFIFMKVRFKGTFSRPTTIISYMASVAIHKPMVFLRLRNVSLHQHFHLILWYLKMYGDVGNIIKWEFLCFPTLCCCLLLFAWHRIFHAHKLSHVSCTKLPEHHALHL